MSKNINIPFIDFNNTICLSELKRWLNEYKISLSLDKDDKGKMYVSNLTTSIESKRYDAAGPWLLLSVLNDKKSIVTIEMDSLYRLKIDKKKMTKIDGTLSKKFLIDGKFIKKCKSKKDGHNIVYKMTLAAFIYYIIFETYFIESHFIYVKRPELELYRPIDFLSNCKALVTVKIPPRKTDVHRKQTYYIYIDR